MMDDTENGKITVWPLQRDCRGCYHLAGGCRLATWCATLVRSETGEVFVYGKGIEDGAGGFLADRSELSPPPRALR